MAETEEFLGDVDEDLEAMQGTVYLLQQELKDAKERLQQQQLELDQLRDITSATAGAMNSVPVAAAATCSEQSATSTSMNALTGDSDSIDVHLRQKMSSDALMRTAGKDGTRVFDEKFVKKEPDDPPVHGSQRNILDDSNRIQNMDVDDAPANCSYSNDLRTSAIEHHNDALSSEQRAAETSGLHRSMVDRFRPVSKVGAAELTTGSDCVPNGTDDDKAALAVAGN